MQPEKGGPLRKGWRATLKGEPTGRYPRAVKTMHGRAQKRREREERLREYIKQRKELLYG